MLAPELIYEPVYLGTIENTIYTCGRMNIPLVIPRRLVHVEWMERLLCDMWWRVQGQVKVVCLWNWNVHRECFQQCTLLWQWMPFFKCMAIVGSMGCVHSFLWRRYTHQIKAVLRHRRPAMWRDLHRHSVLWSKHLPKLVSTSSILT